MSEELWNEIINFIRSKTSNPDNYDYNQIKKMEFNLDNDIYP